MGIGVSKSRIGPTLTAHSGPWSAGEGWCARSQCSGEPGPQAKRSLSKGLLVLCGLNACSVTLGVFYVIPTTPHQLPLTIATPILWTRHDSQTSV